MYLDLNGDILALHMVTFVLCPIFFHREETFLRAALFILLQVVGTTLAFLGRHRERIQVVGGYVHMLVSFGHFFQVSLPIRFHLLNQGVHRGAKSLFDPLNLIILGLLIIVLPLSIVIAILVYFQGLFLSSDFSRNL